MMTDERQRRDARPPTPSTSPSFLMGELKLNDIQAEMAGGRVRIAAVMDREGLEKLEKKIPAFKELLS